MSKATAKDFVKTGRIFFYPASGFDWRPIRSFSRECDTFVYCDWRMTVDDFTRDGYPRLSELCTQVGQPVELAPQDLVDGQNFADPGFLTPEECEHYRRGYDAHANKAPWGRLVPLTLGADGRESHVTLIYLCAEGVATYLQLFKAQGVKPTHLCMVNPSHYNWTDFRDYTQPLGRAVDKDIQFLISDTNWPQDEFVQHLGWAGARVYRCFDPRDYFLPSVVRVRGDIFHCPPVNGENCDALALWLRGGGYDLPRSWQAFAAQLQGFAEGRVNRLVRDTWREITIGPDWRPWKNPLGTLIRLAPPLDHLRHIYVIPNLDDTFVGDPAQARPLVLGALETLNEAGAEVVAMNGIQGNPHELDGQIAQAMADAVREWLRLGKDEHRAEVSIRRVFLVDLRGGFDGVHLA